MKSPTAYPVFYRTYSRFINDQREDWAQVTDRVVIGLAETGDLTQEEAELLTEQQLLMRALPSGRLLWVGGTKWSEKPENFPGSYNCSSTNIDSFEAIANTMDLAMMGCGTGANLEHKYVDLIPTITRKINVVIVKDEPPREHSEFTEIAFSSCDGEPNYITILVGDSRQGWVSAYLQLMLMSVSEYENEINVVVDLSHVRPAGTKLKGFGGTANPVKLAEMFIDVANVLNNACGRKLTPLDCCKIIDIAAVTVVAGNIRRSAGIRQFDRWDEDAIKSKDNLWVETNGVWSIDPDRDMLRLANHTVVYHSKPTLEQCIASVTKQYYSGEGALMWAGEAVARANADIIVDKKKFLDIYNESSKDAAKLLRSLSGDSDDYRASIYGLNPCGEILLSNNLCNLSEVHLNNIEPCDLVGQKAAFTAAGISVAALLNHRFTNDKLQGSRERDPIVAVSFTGLFDFFVQAFGIRWLEWWQAGRPADWGLRDSNGFSEARNFEQSERDYLQLWREWATESVYSYCDKHGLKCPNRCTSVQPAGSKSLLTGASCGFHPPKAAQYIRRITFAKNDPVALACVDYGYTIVPSQADKDLDGNLLNDPHSVLCTEWLVEIPVSVPWADLPGADDIDISKFSAVAQLDFAMQVQNHYVTHNLSATIELRESEITDFATAIYRNIQNDAGYISAALLARFDDLQTFPRLPFEPIDRATYLRLSEQVLERRTSDFKSALDRYDALDSSSAESLSGAAGCDSDKCLLPDTRPSS